jgi:hypothetical protein
MILYKDLNRFIQLYKMPRKPIDYSKTIIYKLCCNDPSITDIYTGHTTDFKTRKSNHKNRCNNPNDKKHNYYVYQFIRNHGGFDNWSMIEIEKICCIDEIEACKYERKYFDLLGATLNTNTPSRTNKEYNEEHKEHLKELHKKYYEENKEVIAEKNKKYREENKDTLKEKQKEYREKNKEEINAKQEVFRQNNKDIVKNYTKTYLIKNKERIKERKKEYYERNKDKILQQKKEYYLKNKESKTENI